MYQSSKNQHNHKLLACTTKVKGNATLPHHYPLKVSEPSTDHIIQAYSDIFQDTKKLKNYKLQLHINHNITLVQQLVRQILFHSRLKVKNELQRLLDLGIIKKNSRPTSWLNHFVQAPKTIWLCIDMRQANRAIIMWKTHHPSNRQFPNRPSQWLLLLKDRSNTR